MTESNIAQNPPNDFPYIPADKRSHGHRRPVFGVGKNDAPYMVTHKVTGNPMLMCPYYRVWVHMLERVNCPKFHARQPTYVDCSIDSAWLYFMNFREWMAKQEWEGKQIDKDILTPGNKIYGPEFCVFVTPRVNTLLNDSAAARGQWPIGVYLNKPTGLFGSHCSNGNGSEHIGCFNTPEQAHAAYCQRKSEIIAQVAEEQSDPRVRDALLLLAQNMISV